MTVTDQEIADLEAKKKAYEDAVNKAREAKEAEEHAEEVANGSGSTSYF